MSRVGACGCGVFAFGYVWFGCDGVWLRVVAPGCVWLACGCVWLACGCVWLRVVVGGWRVVAWGGGRLGWSSVTCCALVVRR